MRPPLLIDPPTFDERIALLTAHGGDHIAAGLTLEEVGDMIFTRRTNVSPQSTVLKEPKAKAAPKRTTGAAKLDDLLG